MRNRAIITAMASALGCASSAFAASGAEYEGSGFLLFLFLGFGALVIAFQFIPGVVMFYSMIKGLLTSSTKENPAQAENK